MAAGGNSSSDVKSVVQSFDSVPRLLYDKILAYCRTNPSDLSQAKLLFVTALDKQIEHLLCKQSYTEIFDCFDDALTLFPDDSDVLNALGVALNRLQKPLESLKYFHKAHQLCPTKLKILENRMNVINEWIPRWHFIMLNDTKRNEAFRRAITNRIREEGRNVVLDIGTGTGLLALYSHEAGAKKIYACESNEIMIEIAENVFRSDHKYDNIELLKDHSTNLSSKDLNDCRVDLIVTEIFDSGIFGEGVLSTLIHAKENLLKDNGKIIPNKVKVFVVGADCLGMAQKQECINRTLENSIYIKNTILIPKTDEPYDTYNHREEIGLDLKTAAVHTFTVDFNDLESMRAAESGKLDSEIQLKCLRSGSIEGFLVYFGLYLEDNEDNVLHNFFPAVRNSTTLCWDPAVFRLSQPLDVQKDEILNVTVSCKDGVLNLKHQFDSVDKLVVPVDPELFSFLADEEYLSELEYNVINSMKKRKRKATRIADFSTFPHVGINLLKEKEIDTLYCLETRRDFIQEIADWNCISMDSIQFVHDLEDLIQGSVKLDLILLQPITGHGTLNEDQLKYHEKLAAACLIPNGIIYPSRMDICAKLIHSSWLRDVTRVNDELNLPSSVITKCMNAYSTQHHFDVKNFYRANFCLPLSDAVVLSKIHFDEQYHEQDVVFNLNMTRNHIDGILYFFKIFFSPSQSSNPIVTNRRKSFCTQNCFVQNVDVVDNRTSLKVRFVQDEYVIRCEVLESS